MNSSENLNKSIEEKSIGIDLGTTNSVVAVCGDNSKPIVLKTPEGRSFLPSVVSIKDENLLVGLKARNNASVAPENTIISIKRFMGLPFDDENVQMIIKEKRFSYLIEQADETDDRGVRVVLHGMKKTPEEISAMILREIIGNAAKETGEKITHAVITVPAYFSEIQRLATRKAGEQANVIIKKIVDEPTAAAFAFGETHEKEGHQLLIFDFGGGTLDISIGYIRGDQFAQREIDGDRWMGGDDFNQKIVNLIIKDVEKKYGNEVKPEENKLFIIEAFRAAEKAKITLSTKIEAHILIPGALTLPGGQRATVSMIITREQFEQEITEYVEKAKNIVTDLLAKKDMKPGDISSVLLIGGSTMVPAVREMLYGLFGKDKIRDDVHPMEAVALGAAILAYNLRGIICPGCKELNPYTNNNCKKCNALLSTGRDGGKVVLHEVTERSFGIAAKKGDDPDIFSVLIKKGTPYPLTKPEKNNYLTTARLISIPVYAGENEKASKNEYLGKVEYILPDTIPSRTLVTISFNYDRNRILKVYVEINGFPELNFEMTPKRHLPDQKISKEDKWRLSLKGMIQFSNHITEHYDEFIQPEDKKQLDNLTIQAKQALANEDSERAQEISNDFSLLIDKTRIVVILFISDRLMNEVDAKEAEWLAVQTKKLRDAYRAQEPWDLIYSKLDTKCKKIIEKTPVSPVISGFGGILEIYKT